MQNLTQTGLSLNKVGGGLATMNGSANNSMFLSTNLQTPENFIFEQDDPSPEEDDYDSGHEFQQIASNSGLKPGKKTKGRVKIKMEFIENKLRRYTTFSKRKTGIMKKAYELSTLTGTQVMLLVASETGHVYTFATRKLQPMITSESGKALIQTCLNSPDPPPGTSSGNVLEQRMNPSGFEETDLSCAVGEDDQQKLIDSNCNMKTVFPMPSHGGNVSPQDQLSVPSPSSQVSNPQPTYTLQSVAPTGSTASVSKTFTLSTNSSSTTSNASTTNTFQTMQLPFIVQSGGAISMLQPTSQQMGQAITVSQSQNVLKAATLGQVMSTQNSELNTPLPVSTPSHISFMQGMTPGIVMYHTPQGVVYATPTQNLHDRTIFNFPQPTTAISLSQTDQSAGHQLITIPVPVSISGNSILQLAATPNVDNSSGETTISQPPPLKKAKK
ncbi:serum response factor-like isoform X2 [Physella acuta]|uniref:serum response factor-like isoform X2 n=1 Tax=Physella acuta TaxID=109671 RepID=UPI0027DC3808|nr:serum response factor-like isoform X2 [Physella acuta]